MICHQGVVSRITDGRATVEVKGGSACQACARGRGCGLGVFSGWFGRHTVRLDTACQPDWAVGDAVSLSISRSVLAGLALRAYGLPILAFLATAAGASVLLPPGAVADFGGLLLGLVALMGTAYLGGRGAAAEVRYDAPNRSRNPDP